MTLEELRAEFGRLYLQSEGSRVETVHLFGIKYVEQLRGVNLPEFCAGATVPVSIATELRKGMKLAKYVELKPGAL